MKKKHFSYGKGMYYFVVKSGQQSITIKRKSKKEALQSYNSYLKIGKTTEWLGKWSGKEFTETKAA